MQSPGSMCGGELGETEREESKLSLLLQNGVRLRLDRLPQLRSFKKAPTVLLGKAFLQPSYFEEVGTSTTKVTYNNEVPPNI